MRVSAVALMVSFALAPAIASADASVDAGFVASVYQTLLGRTADSVATATFRNSPANRQQVVATIVGSQEFRTREVAAFYQTFLNRPADGSASALIGLLRGGSPASLDADVQVAAVILGSPEYLSRRGPSNASFITGVYQDLLHRTPSTTELNVQLPFLNQLLGNAPTPSAGRTQFAAYILGSVEGKQDLIGLLLPGTSGPNLVAAACSKLQCTVPSGSVMAAGPSRIKTSSTADYVNAAYHVVLGRGPDAASALYTSRLADGSLTHAQFVTSLESSPEFRNHVVDFFYEKFLGRHAGQQDLAFMGNLLTNGAQPNAIAIAIVGSPEYYQKGGNKTAAGYVDNAYVDVLGSHPDNLALAKWANALSNGSPRSAFAKVIVTDGTSRLQDALINGVLHGTGAAPGATLLQAALTETDNALR